MYGRRLCPGEEPYDKNFTLYLQRTEGEAQLKNALSYGLFCEHTVEDQLQWNGNNSSMVSYQAISLTKCLQNTMKWRTFLDSELTMMLIIIKPMV